MSPLNNPQAILADIAEREVGNKEFPLGSNRGPQVEKYFEADDLEINGKTDGYPWCMAFLDWVIQEAIRKEALIGLKTPPKFAATAMLKEWAQANGCTVFEPMDKHYTAQRGDLIKYTFSHVGIVADFPKLINGEWNVRTIEGNTGDKGEREGTGVFAKWRTFGEIDSFIRLAAKTSPANAA